MIVVNLIHEKPPFFCLGPLGCFDRGQKLTLEDHGEVLVTNVDWDGAAVAFLTSFLRQYADENKMSADEVLAKYSKKRSPQVADLVGRSKEDREKITARILGNRQRAGLSAIDPPNWSNRGDAFLMADEKQVTERVVLKQVETFVEGHPPTPPPVWEEIGTTFRGTKKQAIEAYAGKNGKDKPGVYRAPSLRSWKGEFEFEPDPEPKMKVTERE